MKNLLLITILSVSLSAGSCQSNHEKDKYKDLNATEFAQELANNKDIQLIDVRTPGEYNEGHIENAVNIDYNSDQFEKELTRLDKNKQTLVYCLSGGRSSSAVSKMKSLGFNEVHNLEGGILKWKSAGQPVKTAATKPTGMTLSDFNTLLNTDKLVLVDYQAAWCAPCKKLSPIVEKIAKQNAEKLILIEVDIDTNSALATEKNINEIPLLELYQNGKLIWQHLGLTNEKTILKAIKL